MFIFVEMLTLLKLTFSYKYCISAHIFGTINIVIKHEALEVLVMVLVMTINYQNSYLIRISMGMGTSTMSTNFNHHFTLA